MLMDSVQEGTWLRNAVTGSHRAQEEAERFVFMHRFILMLAPLEEGGR